ncbi:polysaccharide pyruvyl transferase family protein [Paenibacillus sp. N3.4]|uniref:polysaccharide pyruvyl transferase family protein n=1 Tax=Paenibacillus sp. N3.4 TaxID=2603222 RepID=UPI0011C7BD37|nr:polysaccharide pyruvyl transferase family protein [Paenibacillus sp. N3.4]TXK77948.1 polysaccharide pyruvyl transferase family protein [Paenibacillus sp. N3.4]
MKILISAYLDNNIGDDLMIKLLATRFPECSFYIDTNNSAVINTFSQNGNIFCHKFNKSKRYLRQFQVHLSIGGSLFNNINSLMGIVHRILRIILLYRLKKNNIKLATIGCNLGPYKNRIGPLLTKIELQLNNLITVRDLDSYNLIENFKSIKNFYLASDIVFNYSDKKDAVENNKPTCLGISTYRSIQNKETNYSSYVFLSAIADGFIEKTGSEVYLFAFDSENENDLSSAHHIKYISKYPEKISIIPYLGNHESIIKSMKQCDRFVSVRFHSAILCQILNIPFLPIVYSNKMQNYLNDEYYNGLLLQFKDMSIDKNNVAEIVNSIIENKNIFNDFSKSKSDAKVHFDEFNKLVSS